MATLNILNWIVLLPCDLTAAELVVVDIDGAVTHGGDP